MNALSLLEFALFLPQVERVVVTPEVRQKPLRFSDKF